MNKGQKRELLRKVIFAVALILFIGSSTKLFLIWNEYNKNAKSYEAIQEYGPKAVEPKTNNEKNEENGQNGEGENNSENDDIYKYVLSEEDYNKLYSINQDIKGWITVPNTSVNYPIVQGTDNSYYLHHNFNKEANNGGAIFIACENKNPFEDQNTVIHGHHMKDGSMFATLNEFKDIDFFKANKYIYISTKDRVRKYEIFSMYVEKASVNPYEISFSSDEEYLQYLKSLSGKSIYGTDVGEFSPDDKILTLSTCTYEVNDGRLLIHAKLVK
ncbi:MAG: class B sortase [Clostridium sp.]|nr:class B sortase [Clostridium sp.]MCI7442757.1 class B sortase [Clostridium sp.]